MATASRVIGRISRFVCTPAARFAPAVALVVLASTARAGSPKDKATADILFNEGRLSIARGDFEPGCRKLAESQKLDPAIGTLLNLGNCYDKLGRTASAWAQFRQAADMASEAGDKARAEEADRRAREVEPRLRRLRIVAAAHQPSGMIVTRDGVVVDETTRFAPPVDPGDHSIEASAPGVQTWRTTVRSDTPGQTIEVVIPQLKPGPAGTATGDSAASQHARWHAQRWVAVGVGAAGVVGLGVGTVFLLRSNATWNDAQARCPGNVCPDARDVSLEQDARHQATVATVGIGLGVGALAAGTVLWFTAPAAGGPPRDSATRVSLSVRPWGTGLMLGGLY